jgi:hypothetical protein
MANVFLIGLAGKIAEEIACAVSVEHHIVFKRSHSIDISELLHAGIVFVGGPSQIRLSFLRRFRLSFPAMPLVVVAETVGTGEWLDALEAGATDCCWAPVARRQIQRLMESLVPEHMDGLRIGFPRKWTWLPERAVGAYAKHASEG